MRAEVFDIAVSALSFHGAHLETPRIVQAARAVMVDGVRPGEAAVEFEFPPERVSEAVGRIRDKWAAICAERGLVTETFSLSPILIELIRQIELEALQPLQSDLSAKRRKKSAAAAKIVELPTPLKPAAGKQSAEKSAAPQPAASKPASPPVAAPIPAKRPLPKVAEKKPGKYKKPPVKK